VRTPKDVLEAAELRLTKLAEDAAALDGSRPLHPAHPSPTPGELQLYVECSRLGAGLAAAQRAFREEAASDLEVFGSELEELEDGLPLEVPAEYVPRTRLALPLYLAAAGILGVVEGFAVLQPLQTVLATEGPTSYAMAAVVGAVAPVLAHLAGDRPRFGTSFLPPVEQRRQRRLSFLGLGGLVMIWLLAVVGRASAGSFAAAAGQGIFTVGSVVLYVVFQTVFIIAALTLAYLHFRNRDDVLARGRAAYGKALGQQRDASRMVVDTTEEREATEREELLDTGARAVVTYRERLETSDQMPLEFGLRWSGRTRDELAAGLPARLLRGLGGPVAGGNAPPGAADRDAAGGSEEPAGLDLGLTEPRGPEVDELGDDPDADPDLLRRLVG
jgi:hypothetical protein